MPLKNGIISQARSVLSLGSYSTTKTQISSNTSIHSYISLPSFPLSLLFKFVQRTDVGNICTSVFFERTRKYAYTTVVSGGDQP